MYKILDLFCGIGGFSYGFEMTGKFKTVLGVDEWPIALKTFKENHPDTNITESDIKQLDKSYWLNFKNKIDVVLAGPPCQGFSMAGKRDVLDERNNLFLEVIRIVEIIKPKIVVIENVVGLLSMIDVEGNYIKDEIEASLKRLNYKVESKVLTASNYGVPQNRKRVIFIASLKDNIIFPEPSHGINLKSVVTVGEALGNIPEIGKEYLMCKNEYQRIMRGNNKILNHDPISHNEKIIGRMKSVPPGGNWKDIPIELGQGGGKHSNNYRRLKSSEPSITIKHVSKSMIIHPEFNRTPTIREVARLQSFDDNFILIGTKYDQYQELANAVPPLLGKAIGNIIARMLGDFYV